MYIVQLNAPIFCSAQHLLSYKWMGLDTTFYLFSGRAMNDNMVEIGFPMNYECCFYAFL